MWDRAPSLCRRVEGRSDGSVVCPARCPGVDGTGQRNGVIVPPNHDLLETESTKPGTISGKPGDTVSVNSWLNVGNDGK